MSPSTDPTVNNLQDDQARPLLSYLDEAAKFCWDSWDWASVCVIEQRWYSAPYKPGINLTAGVLPQFCPGVINLPYDPVSSPNGSIIYSPRTGIYWMALQSGDPGSPDDFPGAYQQVTLIGQVNIYANPYLLDAPLLGPPFPPPPPSIPPASGLVTIAAVVPYIQSGKGEIDTTFEVFATDPRNTTHPIPISYSTSVRGLELMSTQLTNVWVHYRPPFPGIGSEPWVSGTYNLDDIVYFNGDSWYSNVPNNTATPGDASNSWTMFRLPSDLSAGVLAWAYALALEEDGQDTKAQSQYTKANMLFMHTYDKEQTQQGLTSRFSVIVR